MRTGIVALIMLCLAGASAARAAEPANAPRKPNVIVILADDLGYADVGAQRVSADVKTPHLDSIAANGVRFTSAYVTAPVCAPSRAGLLSGRYQQRFGFEMNPGGENFPNYGLPLTETTIAQSMKNAGYRTGMIGKWHLGNQKPRTPLDRGFDEYYGFWGGKHSYTEQTPGFNAVRDGDEKAAKVQYLTDEFGREAAAFVERNHEKPFFLYVAFNAVHGPMQAPPRYVERFAGVADRKRRLMLAMLASMDDAIGRVLAKVREHGLEEQTLIFFTSDNGGPTDGNASSNAPFSGYKNQLFEGGIRVPLFAQWKGRIPAGRVIDHAVTALDITATAAAVARPGGSASAPATAGAADRALDGVNLMPWLEGKREDAVHETLYWRYSNQWAIRQGDWKLMGVGDYAKLFNLAEDPGEKRDRSADHPDVRRRLLAAYAAWNETLAAPLWSPNDPSKMDRRSFDTQETLTQTRARRAATDGGSKRDPDE